MARLAVAAAFGVLVGLVAGAALGIHASEDEDLRPVVVRANCVVFYESRWNANAVNPRSGASGLGQFLPSTWRTTPQGKAGRSVFDPWANHAAVVWMLEVGRGREFQVITRGLC